jgi:sortase A
MASMTTSMMIRYGRGAPSSAAEAALPSTSMRARTAATAAALTLVSGCSSETDALPERSASSTATPSPSPARATPATGRSATGTSEAPSTTPEPEPPLATDGRPREARLSVPALGLSGLRVVPYVGTPDDGPGTAIQNDGFAASPHSTGGLVGPGGIGNYLITGHRSSSTAPFRYLPSVRVGARIVVETVVHRVVHELVYAVVGTRRTSFRSAASLRAQSAALPGAPGREPTRAMITLSTCATFEDHAAGNFWYDEFHNPEHRIEKIGVLRSIRLA